ncbi:MAG TPA: hypothetical protein VEK08_13485 [Planctomycetota bacterium]|nr:hypothetical protein [Planctomycetota bacterium]
MHKKLIFFALASSLIMALCAGAGEPSLKLYVAPGGNDAWSGQLAEANAVKTDGPLASLGRARDVIRGMKAAGKKDVGVQVFVRGGRYEVAEPLVFTPEDSGSAQAPIVYAAFEKRKTGAQRRAAGFRLQSRRARPIHRGDR